MKILSLLVQILHLAFAVFSPLVPILTDKYDLYYVIVVFLTTLHWNIFKGECIASYYEKKFLDPNYKLGDNNDSLFKNILGKNTTDIFIQLNFIGLLIVIHRNYGLKNFRTIALLVFFSIIFYYSSSSKIKSNTK
jgi:hypothetical protein